MDESAEYDYADDFDDDAHDGTDRALDPLLNPPSVPKSVGVSAELLIDGGDLGVDVFVLLQRIRRSRRGISRSSS